VARAIVDDAEIIIADEPTGNLDSKAGHDLMRTLDHFHQIGKTILLVTHNLSYLAHADTKIAMKDGRIIGKFHENALPHKIKEELEEE
jgi:ABC-type lipoprotein export system ATPase subunit